MYKKVFNGFFIVVLLLNLTACSGRYADITKNEDSADVEGVLSVNLCDEKGTVSVYVYEDAATAEKHASVLDLFPTGWGYGQRRVEFTISSSQNIISVKHVGSALSLVTNGWSFYTTNLDNVNLIKEEGTNVKGEAWMSKDDGNIDTLVIELENGDKYYVAYKDID